MEQKIGVELTREINDVIAHNIDIQFLINNYQLDYYQFGLIVENKVEQEAVINLLKKLNVFEGCLTLYELINPVQRSTYTDFGFISKRKSHYLFASLIIPFTIKGAISKQVEDALAQMEEHLVASEQTASQTFYYVERYHQQLIEGISKAYDVYVTFSS